VTTPQTQGPRLRPLSLGEILDVSIKICMSRWRTLLAAVLIVVVPVQIVSTILTADYTVSSLHSSFDSFDVGSNQRTADQTLDELNQYIGGLAVSTVLQILAVLLATATCFRAIAQAYLGEKTDWRSSTAYALRHLPALLWLTLLYGLGVLLGTVLLVLPGIWLYISWAFAIPVMLVEGARGRAALGRSLRLVRRRWWPTFGTIAIGFILAGIISTVVQLVFFAAVFADVNNDALVLVLASLAGIVGLAISTPLQAALLTVLYFDLRVRKEGFDLELLANEIGGGAAPEPEPEPVTLTAPPSLSKRPRDGDAPPRLPGVPDG
jgi:hypothetical protein